MRFDLSAIPDAEERPARSAAALDGGRTRHIGLAAVAAALRPLIGTIEPEFEEAIAYGEALLHARREGLSNVRHAA